jgi:hypothetical protein
MEQPFWFADLWNVLLFALGLMVILHLLLVWIRPLRLTATQWKRTDYLTVTLTSLSLISAVAATRQLQLPIIDATLGARLSEQNWSVTHQVDWSRDYFCGLAQQQVDANYPDYPGRAHVLEQWRRACDWFSRARALLEQERAKPDAKVGPELFADDREITDPTAREYIDGLFRYTTNVRDLAGKRDNMRRQLGSQEIDLYLTIFAPLLLAIAFALRITKVTGELRNSKDTARRFDPPPITSVLPR